MKVKAKDEYNQMQTQVQNWKEQSESYQQRFYKEQEEVTKTKELLQIARDDIEGLN